VASGCDGFGGLGGSIPFPVPGRLPHVQLDDPNSTRKAEGRQRNGQAGACRMNSDRMTGKKGRKRSATVGMTGSIAANLHEGSRSEYLAQFVFSSFGTAIPVPHQEDQDSTSTARCLSGLASELGRERIPKSRTGSLATRINRALTMLVRLSGSMSIEQITYEQLPAERSPQRRWPQVILSMIPPGFWRWWDDRSTWRGPFKLPP
jgi:hypothetical protein